MPLLALLDVESPHFFQGHRRPSLWIEDCPVHWRPSRRCCCQQGEARLDGRLHSCSSRLASHLRSFDVGALLINYLFSVFLLVVSSTRPLSHRRARPWKLPSSHSAFACPPQTHRAACDRPVFDFGQPHQVCWTGSERCDRETEDARAGGASFLPRVTFIFPPLRRSPRSLLLSCFENRESPSDSRLLRFVRSGSRPRRIVTRRLSTRFGRSCFRLIVPAFVTLTPVDLPQTDAKRREKLAEMKKREARQAKYQVSLRFPSRRTSSLPPFLTQLPLSFSRRTKPPRAVVRRRCGLNVRSLPHGGSSADLPSFFQRQREDDKRRRLEEAMAAAAAELYVRVSLVLSCSTHCADLPSLLS